MITGWAWLSEESWKEVPGLTSSGAWAQVNWRGPTAGLRRNREVDGVCGPLDTSQLLVKAGMEGPRKT